MPEMMMCPVCGRMFPADEYMTLDNGNPACPDCVQKEQEELEEREEQ